jgi:class 3 adenylate cyclase
MSDMVGRFEALKKSVDPEIVDMLLRFVESAPDEELGRINAIALAEKLELPVDKTIDALVHATKLGLFEISWNLLCPGCGGVLDACASLRGVKTTEYDCALCAAAYSPSLDEMVEVTFTVSPQLRRIAEHTPDSMSVVDYYRRVYFSNALELPRGQNWQELWNEFTLEAEIIQPGEKVILSIQLPAEFIILFEPVVHAATFIDVKGEATRERRELSIVYTESGSSTRTITMAPGPLRITLENRTGRRIVPGLFVAGEKFHTLFENRRQILTAKRLFTSQTFRDLYRTDTLDVDQRLRIANLTVLFTDLKGSTELYDRVGDLAAYDLVRQHFRVLAEVVREHSGAVVKTIGDAVMATFSESSSGINAAIAMRNAIDQLNSKRGSEDLLVKIGLHEGPCLAVVSNERLDYFGQAVNIAARVQGLATERPIFATASIVENEQVRAMLAAGGHSIEPRRAMLRGIADEMTVYEIS